MTRRAPFRETARRLFKMLKLTIRFQRKTETPASDDVLMVYDDDEFYEMQRVEYKPAEYRKRYQFYLEQGKTIEYISDLLKALRHDVDPFEYIQIDTAMHPSILYHTSDLDCNSTRWLIEDMVAAAIRRPIRIIKSKTDAPLQ